MASKVTRILESVHRSESFPLGETRQHKWGHPSEQVLALPYYRYVPKDMANQLYWRHYVRVRGAEDIPFRHAILQACEEDPLFFANTMCWVFEPRKDGVKTLPMNTWENQDDHLCWLDEAFGKRDAGVEKSRDESITWNALVMSYRHWRFDALTSMALVTLNEDKVDSPDDSDSLMWKLRFLHDRMPKWFRFDRLGEILVYRNFDHRFHNRLKGSTYTGYACTGNVSRGGRKIWALMDEFAEWPISQQQKALDSTQFALKSRLVVSTFTGQNDRFYQIMRKEQSEMLKIIADWKDNPAKRKGLYTSFGGTVKILDPSYDFTNYPFVLDGKERSPYYDRECKRLGATPQSIAKELDRDPTGVTAKVFSEAVLHKAADTCRAPYFRGNLDFTPGEYEPIWVPDDNGKMFVWKDMSETTFAGRRCWKLGYGGPYAVGADIATGAGSSESSNSALEVIDIASGEQVLEYYYHAIRPVDFAQLAYVVCKWLCLGHDLSWAYLNCENQGIGEAFVKEILRLNWFNTYKTINETREYQQRTDKIGYHNSDGGFNILSELQRGIQQDEVTVRSEKIVLECGQYEMGTAGRHSGKCVHAGSKAAGELGKSHGDCAIAFALAWMAARDRPVEEDKVITENDDARLMEEMERVYGGFGSADRWQANDEYAFDFRNSF